MKKPIKLLLKTTLGLILTLIIFTSTFFYTDVFASYRDLWVETAMNTTSHKYLATWFLSDERIEEITSKYEIDNQSNSSTDLINVSENASTNITYEEISTDTYNGYVIVIDNNSSLQLVDTTLNDGTGIKLSQTVQETSAIAAINGGGYCGVGPRSGKSSVGYECTLTIIDGELVAGETNEATKLVGFNSEGVMILGTYTYEEAIDVGITNALAFGPFLIVDGVDQVTYESSGGLQPRTAIGQTADGSIIMVVIEGRSSTSLGATYYDLQEIMKSYGAVNATNLDGGGSSAMFYEGELVNNLSNGSERSITTAFIVLEEE